METFQIEGVTYYPFCVRYTDARGAAHRVTVFSPGHVDMWLGPATRHVLQRRHGSLEGLEITSIDGDTSRAGVL
jgi:hypothetical protein